MGRALTPALIAGALLLALPAASASPEPTTRISVGGGGAQANGRSFAPAISADGRLTAYNSEASNLVAGDTNRARDVFVYDRDRGETTRVSVDSSGAQGNGDSFAPAVSADGRFVVFSSFASNLVPGDTNGADDIFVRDRTANTTARISLGPGGAEADGGSFQPAISATGRFVVYASDATNLVAGDTNGVRDTFVYDREIGTTSRVSLATTGDQANLDTFTPTISADGRFVAFTSYSTNLVPEDINEGSDVFVHDRETGATSRVSVYTGGYEADGDSLRSQISSDGRYVVFDSDAWNLSWGDWNEAFDVFVHDRQTGVTTRISVDEGGGPAEGESIRPSISADGRFVAYSTEASNVVAGDTNGSSDVMLYDRRSRAPARMSVANSEEEGNGDSLRPALAADGRVVAFDSEASNLVGGDTNRFTDIFLRDTTAAQPPPPPPPPARCIVPRVIGLRLAVARKRIGRANCRVGRVRRTRSRRVGRVLAQSPRAGRRLARGARVNLVVGRRR